MFIRPQDIEIFKKLDMKQPYVWLATWFGAGFFRPAPGTWGSALSIPPAIIIFTWGGISALIVGIIAITGLGLWASQKFDQATGGYDNSMIVIDEAVGQWITLIPVCLLAGLNLWLAFLAFLLFRLFDITKPWPISWMDKNIHGAWGVMIDDIAAGILAALCLTGIIHYAGLGF
jgi:phosphatidylglycerophosphatase A